jgi:putative endonuclease
MNTRKKGFDNEAIARDYLEKKGYKILEQNYHFGKLGEIDLICKDKETLVFVEVKSAYNLNFGHPIYKITPSKVKQLFKLAEIYINTKQVNSEIRFDAFFSYKDQNNNWIYEHLIDAMRG